MRGYLHIVLYLYKDRVLIQTTFSFPFVLLYYFSYLHYRFYEIMNKIKMSAYLFASIVQQLGNMKINKQLSIREIGRNFFYKLSKLILYKQNF